MENESPAKRNARFARQTVSRLIAGGCAGVVISPGSRHTPLVMAVANAQLPAEVILDERSAGFFALGWAKARCAPIVLICTSGSAGAHYLPAVIEAWETGVPLVLITTDRPPEHLGIGAPQTTPQGGFYTNHIKGRLSIGAADDCSAIAELDELAKLLTTAGAGKPGPVQVNIGFREPLWEAMPTTVDLETPAHLPPETTALPCDPVALPDTTRGVLVVGPVQEAVPDTNNAVQSLVSLARRRGWPVLADVASGIRHHAPDESSLVHGSDLFLRSMATREALRPDLVLHVGRMPTSKTLFTWLQYLEDHSTDVLHLSTDGQAHSLGRAPRIIPVNWRQLITSCEATDSEIRRPGPWLQQWQRAARLARASVEKESDRAGLWEGAVAKIASRMPVGSSLVLGSGMPIRDADTYVGQLVPGTRCLVNRGVNGIDGLVATAAGVAAASPHSLVRLLIGDQAFLHDLGSLAVAAARPNLEIVVIDNNGSGIFEFLPISQAGESFEKFFLAPQHTDILKAAAAFGIQAQRCTSGEALAQFLDAPRQGPKIAEVVVDREHNVYIHKLISAAVTDRLDQEFHSEIKNGKRASASGRGVEQS